MKKPFKILFAMILFIFQGQAMQDDGLFLVVGSSREKGHTSSIFERVAGPGVDFSHKNSFDGKAVTLDILPCAISNQRHEKHDARTFNPGKHPIRAVYMELLPSGQKIHFGLLPVSKSHPPKGIDGYATGYRKSSKVYV